MLDFVFIRIARNAETIWRKPSCEDIEERVEEKLENASSGHARV